MRAPGDGCRLFHVRRETVHPEEWSSPPLEARLVPQGGLGTVCMGRGAVNQKGPQNSFLSALQAFKAAGRKLPVNLVLVSEGEEEIGSPHFGEIVFRSRSAGTAEEVCRSHVARRGPGKRTAVSSSISARRAWWSWNWSAAASNGAAARHATFTPVSRRRSILLPGIWYRRSTRWWKRTAIRRPSRVSSRRRSRCRKPKSKWCSPTRPPCPKTS